MIPDIPDIPDAPDTKEVVCNRPWNDLWVQTDGKVFNCCYQGQSVGNANDTPLIDIWNGPLQEEVRQGFLDGKIPAACQRGIGFCPALGRK